MPRLPPGEGNSLGTIEQPAGISSVTKDPINRSLMISIGYVSEKFCEFSKKLNGRFVLKYFPIHLATCGQKKGGISLRRHRLYARSIVDQLALATPFCTKSALLSVRQLSGWARVSEKPPAASCLRM